MKTNHKCRSSLRRPLCLALGLAGLSLLPLLPASAALYTVESPSLHHTWSWGQIANKQLYSDHGRLRASITFTTEPYASHDVASMTESKEFTFPGITYDARSGCYMARLSNGRSVAVARKVDDVLFSSVELLPGNHLRVYRDSDAVRVALQIDTSA